ncbi:hypothetical protein KVR01_008950 [Diaporthe batatas]|uniref:uncharacterized protein n=1 Tax=Diaporthe batatas TaxID=748121 RepID=UPI001D05B714|nr:uncharacterized protein KVR01_008950 [Diaporthe batatas]KAG8160686.1 hypothetical protein KVR01_008950 [Diaporthe batatas]
MEEPNDTSKSEALARSDAVHADDEFPENQPADHFPKFGELPTELRLLIWEQAFLEENFRFRRPFPLGSVQRFRFDLRRDPNRVKPGRDGSRSGWVACFTPLSINTRPYYKFLRASSETRKWMARLLGMSVLTVHELEYDAEGQPVGSPRKRHMPYSFDRDVFCVEAISHGVDLALRHTKGADGKQHRLAEYLDDALGLRFAPRIKRLAIIPHHLDMTSFRHHFFGHRKSRRMGDMVALAKRFPSLVTLRSAIPQFDRGEVVFGLDKHREKFPRPPKDGYFQWVGASLRGRGQGGPTRMSEEDRHELPIGEYFFGPPTIMVIA